MNILIQGLVKLAKINVYELSYWITVIQSLPGTLVELFKNLHCFIFGNILKKMNAMVMAAHIM